jgi:hypothetical protein
MLRQIAVGRCNGEAAPQACKEAKKWGSQCRSAGYYRRRKELEYEGLKG